MYIIHIYIFIYIYIYNYTVIRGGRHDYDNVYLHVTSGQVEADIIMIMSTST